MATNYKYYDLPYNLLIRIGDFTDYYIHDASGNVRKQSYERILKESRRKIVERIASAFAVIIWIVFILVINF